MYAAVIVYPKANTYDMLVVQGLATPVYDLRTDEIGYGCMSWPLYQQV